MRSVGPPRARNGSGARPRSGSPRPKRAGAESARAPARSTAAGPGLAKGAARRSRAARRDILTGLLEKSRRDELVSPRDGADAGQDRLETARLPRPNAAPEGPRSLAASLVLVVRAAAPRARAGRGCAASLRSPLEASRRWAMPRSERKPRISARETPRSGRTTPSSRISRGPARSASPPRRTRGRADATPGRRPPGAPWRLSARRPRPRSRAAPRSARGGRRPRERGRASSRRRAHHAAAHAKGSPSRRACSSTNARSRSASRPRQPWWTWPTERRQPACRRDLRRSVEQGHRVRAAGNGEQDRGVAGEEARSGRRGKAFADRVHGLHGTSGKRGSPRFRTRSHDASSSRDAPRYPRVRPACPWPRWRSVSRPDLPRPVRKPVSSRPSAPTTRPR